MKNEDLTMIKKSKRVIYFTIKRLFDILFSIIGIILMIPIMIIIKIIYMCTGDFSSMFYSHERIGKDGKVFKLYKFRTMVPNADEVLKKLLKHKKYRREWQKNHKLEDDPRITKVGKFLRKSSLDELPQFINVLKNDMSLIGPRPLVEGELEKYHGKAKIYQSIKPGITGWWACNGRSDTTYKRRLELEYYYVKNCSILMDIAVVFLTIKAVLFKTGAK